MKQLFETYGAITPQTLTAAKATLESTAYNHSNPIVNIFTAINNYANMAEVAKAAETPTASTHQHQTHHHHLFYHLFQ